MIFALFPAGADREKCWSLAEGDGTEPLWRDTYLAVLAKPRQEHTIGAPGSNISRRPD